MVLEIFTSWARSLVSGVGFMNLAKTQLTALSLDCQSFSNQQPLGFIKQHRRLTTDQFVHIIICISCSLFIPEKKKKCSNLGWGWNNFRELFIHR